MGPLAPTSQILTQTTEGALLLPLLFFGINVLQHATIELQPRLQARATLPLGRCFPIQNLHPNIQFFPEEYFTGTEVSIFLGDTLVEEISSISIWLQEAVQPVFGFNSYTANAYMRGNRQVQGMFSIPYKETNWLGKVLAQERAKRLNRPRSDAKENWWSDDDRAQLAHNTFIKSALPHTRSDLYSKGDIDALVSAARRWPVSIVREVAKHYQNAQWRRAGQTEEDSDVYRRTVYRNRPLFQDGDPDGFDIIMVTGKPMFGPDGISPHAISMVRGVQITGRNLDITSNDNALMEVYSFIATDLDGHLFSFD